MNGVGGGGRSSGHDGTQQAAYPVPNHQQQQHSPVSNGHASNAAPSQPSSHNSGMSTASHFPAVYPQLLQRNPLSTVPQHGTSNGNSMDATSPLSPAPGSGTTATSLSSFPTMATSTSAPPVSGTTAFASSQGSGGYPSSMQSSTSMPQSQPTSHYTHSSMYGYSSHGSSTVAGSYSAYSSFVPGPGGLPIPGFGYGKGNGVLPPSSNGYASSTISAYNGLQPTLSESLAVVAPQQIMASRGRLPLGHSTQPARPQLSPELHCTCPMICVVATNHGAADALPLPIRNLQMQARCHISTAFVSVQLLCDYPAVWNEAPLVFFLPKTVDTTVTDILVENTVSENACVRQWHAGSGASRQEHTGKASQQGMQQAAQRLCLHARADLEQVQHLCTHVCVVHPPSLQAAPSERRARTTGNKPRLCTLLMQHCNVPLAV